MDVIKYLEEAKRMCEYMGNCRECPFEDLEIVFPCKGASCHLEFSNPKKLVEIVEKWAAEHPKKTRQSEFLKMFPHCVTKNGVVDIYPCSVDSSANSVGHSRCDRYETCEQCSREYWLEEVE